MQTIRRRSGSLFFTHAHARTQSNKFTICESVQNKKQHIEQFLIVCVCVIKHLQNSYNHKNEVQPSCGIHLSNKGFEFISVSHYLKNIFDVKAPKTGFDSQEIHELT